MRDRSVGTSIVATETFATEGDAMSRNRLLVAIGLGLALPALLGSGLLAVVMSSVTSEGNSVQTGVFAAPPGGGGGEMVFLIRATRVPRFTDCPTDPSVYTTGPFTAAISNGTVDLEDVRTATVQEDAFCIMNVGNVEAEVRILFSNVVQTEIGSCAATEAAVEGEGSCTDGSAGELVPVLHSTVGPPGNNNYDTSRSCGTATLPFDNYTQGDGVAIDSSLAPGETCLTSVSLALEGTATESQRRAAQSDRLQWDIVFNI